MDDYIGAQVALAYFVILNVVAAVETWSNARSTAFLWACVSAYLAFGLWALRTGRFGDGGVRLTPAGLVQHARGVEQRVRWENLSITGVGALVDAESHVTFRRWVPLPWVGRWPRAVVGTDTFWLRTYNIHPGLRESLYAAILVWARDDAARREIGTATATLRLLGDSRTGHG
ncbi:MAG: hypothetical protein ACJ72E_00580 [Marmoricola sp.]